MREREVSMHPGITFQENLVLLIAIYQEVIISMAVHYSSIHAGIHRYATIYDNTHNTLPKK